MPGKAPYRDLPTVVGVRWVTRAGPVRTELARWRMSSTLTLLLIVWAGLTTLLVVLLIYRSTLSMHEDDQLFLNDSESHMQAEQTDVLRRLNRVTPAVRLLGAASGLLIVVIAGMWIWEGLSRVQ